MSSINLDGPGLPSEQIYHQVRAIILSGSLGTGEKLPPVRQLARDLGVATGTVAKVYKQLEQEGLVVSRAGGGTRVSSSVPAPPAAVLQAARKLAEVASAVGLSLEAAVGAVQVSWPAASSAADLSPSLIERACPASPEGTCMRSGGFIE